MEPNVQKNDTTQNLSDSATSVCANQSLDLAPIKEKSQDQGQRTSRQEQQGSNKNFQGSWQRVVSQKHGKEPVVVDDHEMNCLYSQEVPVAQVRGRMERDVVVVHHPIVRNG